MSDENSERLGMRGFDAEFADLPHYIGFITNRIWEGRRIDDIKRYYSHPTPSAPRAKLC